MVKHDGFRLSKDAELQAGDILGEMAVITGSGTRNASVIAKTPVTLCVFSVETLKSFIVAEAISGKVAAAVVTAALCLTAASVYQHDFDCIGKTLPHCSINFHLPYM